MALTPAQILLCEKWLKSPSRTWHVLSRGQWKYSFHEKTLVRYVQEATMDERLVPLLLEYLSSPDCISTLQLYSQNVDGAWTPIKAWYEVANASVGKVPHVRLYHALSTEVDGEDGPYIVEKGCAYKVSWTYYWKESEVRSVPSSSSGVSYHITNLSRDPDTGLFNYAIEKRERVQQDIDKYLTETTLYRDTSEEIHLGVKGSESSGGQKASVTPGKTVRRKVTKNQDCTHDVHNTIEEDHEVENAAVTVAESIFSRRETVENRNMPSAAADGSLKPGESVSNEKTASKLFNQRKTKETEKPVKGAAVEYRKGLRGTVKSVTDRNQKAALDFADMETGETRTSRKTDGGNSDNTVSKLVEVTPGELAASEIRTAFQTTAIAHEIVRADGLPDVTVDDAHDGEVVRKEARRNDDGKTADVTTTVTKEKPVSNAVVEKRRTINGIAVTVTSRSMDAEAPEPVVIGGSVTNRITDGGRVDTTVYTPPSSPAGVIGRDCVKNAESHSHSVSSNDAAALGDHVETPDENVEVRTSSRLDAGTGLFNNTMATTEHKIVDSGIYKWKDEDKRYERRTFKNVSKSQLESYLANERGAGSSSYDVTLAPNSHGTFDGGYTITRPREDYIGGAKRTVVQGVSETYISVPISGHWSYGTGPVVTTYTRAWEHRRVATGRIRYDGYKSESAAETAAAGFRESLTRICHYSEWSEAGGGFETKAISGQLMSRVAVVYEGSGIWGVVIDINEQTTRITLSAASGQAQFSIERTWTYP